MKKICLLLALVFVFTLGAFAGCGGPEKEGPKESQMLTNLKEKTILTNQEKVITEPTFDLNRDVSVRSDMFSFGLLFADGMMMQANAVVCIWGECTEDGGIAVEVGDTVCYGNVTDGKFAVWLNPVPYGNYTVNIYTASGRTYFDDVAFGEVFLMSGQSNMGMTVNECLDPKSQTDVCIYQDIIDTYEDDDLRYLKVWPSFGDEPIEELNGKDGQAWQPANFRTIGEMSACAFFFAKRMYELYEVPVGFVQSCMGGTYTVPWLPPETYDDADHYYEGDAENNKFSCRYNTMIHPLRNFVFRGVVWYQGEGQNVGYYQNMNLLIESWRKNFGQDLKFNIVELPRFIANSYQEWFEVREQQARLAEDENVSYSVNTDCGIFERDIENGYYNNGILGEDGIHAPDKEPVGSRAADAFAAKFYDAVGTFTPPAIESASVTDGGVLLTYNVGESKLVLKNRNVGFEVSADGTTYSYAEPEIVSDNQVLLKTPLLGIRFVRYAYTYSCTEVFGGDGRPDEIKNLVCLYNEAGYPADQFLLEIK